MQFIQKNNYLLFVLTLCILFMVIGTKKMGNEVNYEKITVTEGDTLWGYSVQYAENMPTEKWIQEIVKLNNLSSTTIRVGEELRIPQGKGVNRNEIATHMAGDMK